MPQPLSRPRQTFTDMVMPRSRTPNAVRTVARAAVAPARTMSVGRNLTPRGSAATKVRSTTPANTLARAEAPATSTKPTKQSSGPKVAIVHDWLVGGGAELVVEQLHQMFPDAPIYTSYCTKEWRTRLDGKVKTGVLQYWPLSRLRKFIPVLRVWWFSNLDFHGYDLVISSSGAEAKGIRVPPSTLHINYCHAPTHYYWSRYSEYLARPGFGIFDPLARLGLKALVDPLRKWDYKAAQRPDYIIANSTHIKDQIQKYYDRSAIVVHPPVYIERFAKHKGDTKRRGFIITGRQTPYKRFDLAIAACSKLGLPLTVIGNGPDHRRLRKLAGKSVTFLGKVSDEVVAEEFMNARGLIFPGTDDFGIVPVEAMASGTPVIAYKAGGALDYIVPGKTGVFFDKPTAASLAKALREFSRQKFNEAEITHFATSFSRQHFQRQMKLIITKALRETR